MPSRDAMLEWNAMPSADERGPTLARYARACIAGKLGGPAAAAPDAPWTADLAATFVTLRFRDGALQGCIGAIRPVRTILEDVAYNAVAAATRDSRGKKLSLADVDRLDVEVSILSALHEIRRGTEAEMWAQITPGVDGVVLEHEDHRGVLLPVVWERLPSREAFAAALKTKAGLPQSFWARDVEMWRYTVEHHVDRSPG